MVIVSFNLSTITYAIKSLELIINRRYICQANYQNLTDIFSIFSINLIFLKYQSIFQHISSLLNSFKQMIPPKYFKPISQIKKSHLLSSVRIQSNPQTTTDQQSEIEAQCETVSYQIQQQSQLNTLPLKIVRSPIIPMNFISQTQTLRSPLPNLSLIQQQRYIPLRSFINFTYTTPFIPQPLIPKETNKAEETQILVNKFETLKEHAKQEKKEIKIEISIKAQRSIVKLKEAQTVPAMISLKTEGGERTNVDLICVIDVSGSMSGEKISLVKSTMKYLLDSLTPADRLSIITFENFGEVLCGLTSVNAENKSTLQRHIDSLSGRGGTSICSGLDLALKTIKQRSLVNDVTSIFLLSDGQDAGADTIFKQTLEKQKNDLGNFSIHSFGFGTDHDEKLMTNICQIKAGNFYFIKELSTLDEAFCNALGGIISLAAKDVEIKLLNISQMLAKGTSIKKTYGDMWQQITREDYRIKIMQLMSGITKDYVFELQIPKINAKIGDLNRDHDILVGHFIGTTVDGKIISGLCTFKLTFLNAYEQIPDINENVDVIENHLRVLASESIKENMQKADQNRFDEAQKGINSMIAQIKSSKKVRKEKMQNLLQDLEKIKEKCASKKAYLEEGKKWMTSATISHSQQSCFMYSSPLQEKMVDVRRTIKTQLKLASMGCRMTN